jgi:hypothetical protein
MKRSTSTINVISTFSPIEFDFSSIDGHKSCLIYDFAHLFRYIDEDHVGYYEPYTGYHTDGTTEEIKKEKLELASIYVCGGGSLNSTGDLLESLLEYIFKETEFFIVSKDGTVTTFFSKIIMNFKDKIVKKNNLLNANPPEIFLQIIRNIKVKITDKLREEYREKDNKYSKINQLMPQNFTSKLNQPEILITIIKEAYYLFLEEESYENIVETLFIEYYNQFRPNS